MGLDGGDGGQRYDYPPNYPWSWRLWGALLLVAVAAVASFFMVPGFRNFPPPVASVAHAAPPHSDWDVKTKVFWALSSLDASTRLTEGRVQQVVNARARVWVKEHEYIQEVLKIERRWDVELVPSLLRHGIDRHLIFTITIHYLEEEK